MSFTVRIMNLRKGCSLIFYFKESVLKGLKLNFGHADFKIHKIYNSTLWALNAYSNPNITLQQ